MRPSLRQVSKPFEFLVPAATRNRAYFGAPICMQCRIRAQKRCFTNDPKRPDSPKSAIASSTTSSHSVDKSSKIEDVVRDLPSTQESRRSLIGKRFSHLMDNMQGNIFIASQRLNDLTGYSGIEALKERITQLESRVQDAQESVRSSRLAYKTTVADRASTQKEVTGLLARKDTWSPDDLERFTKLYRMDHSNEQAVQEAATRLADAEREAEHAASRLSSSILSRYHEEQIWSDKIRRMSTWGTWGLMGVNVLLFLVFQFGFEPWRRSRLVRGFEEKVLEALERESLNHPAKNDAGKQPLGGTVNAAMSNAGEDRTDRATTDPAETAAPEIFSKGQDSLAGTELQVPMAALQPRKPLDTWIAAVKDLFSKRTISVQKQDMTMAALEGAATGATLAAIIATLIFRHSS